MRILQKETWSQLRTVLANWREESTISFAHYGPRNAGLTHGCEHGEGAGSVDSPDVPHPGGDHLLDLNIFFSQRDDVSEKGKHRARSWLASGQPRSPHPQIVPKLLAGDSWLLPPAHVSAMC